MLAYLKEKNLVISLLTIIMDGIMVYFIPAYYQQLNYFYPMLTISLIPFLYHGNERKYYQDVFLLGIIYDLLFSNLLLFNAFIFLFLGKINYKTLKWLKNNCFSFLLLIIINIILYDLICFLLVLFTKYNNVSIMNLFYKIEHSLPLNILSGFWFYLYSKKKNHYS